MITKTCLAAIAFAVAPAQADQAMPSVTASFTYDFESDSPGSTITQLDFGSGLIADVTSTARHNRVHDTTDGYGAVAADGSYFWKLLGGSTTLSFNQPISGLDFWYSDLEWATLRLSFGPETIDIIDNNPNAPEFFSWDSSSGPVTSLTLDWIGHQGDGVGFDAFAVRTAAASQVPAPNAATMILVGGLAITARRRR